MPEQTSIYQDRNQVEMCGIVAETPRVSHIANECTFYTFPLIIPRLSGTEDRLQVIAPHIAFDPARFPAGTSIHISGSIRSRNVHENERYRLILSVYAQQTEPDNDCCFPQNDVRLTGTVCKPPVYRVTPLGREVCDIMLAVRRRYGRADFLPLIAWGKNAVAASSAAVGQWLDCSGRFQSRIYTKTEAAVTTERTAFEVSLASLSLLKQMDT